MYTTITDCRLCHAAELTDVLDLGNLALTGVFPKTHGEDVPAGPLTLAACQSCGLVQLRQSYDVSMLYGNTYGYRSGLNQSMVAHLQHRVDAIESLVALRAGDVVVDIGSNDGTLLNSYRVSGLRRIGIDPSGPKFRSYYAPGVELLPEFFSASALRKTTDRNARVVTSIAMFYDLERPLKFASEVLSILADDGIWVFEQSYLPLMVETNSYDTICHEHLEYYGLQQILYITRKLDLKIVALETNDTNGGSFAVTVARRSAPYQEAGAIVEEMLAREIEAGYNSTAPLHRLREHMEKHRTELRGFLEQVKQSGKTVFGYGASTKGNVVLQYCGITPDLLPCIAEVNPDKFGSFTPGTKIAIVPESEARANKPDYFLVLPWHFRNGIIARETEYLSSGGKLVFPLPTIDVVVSSAAGA